MMVAAGKTGETHSVVPKLSTRTSRSWFDCFAKEGVSHGWQPSGGTLFPPSSTWSAQVVDPTDNTHEKKSISYALLSDLQWFVILTDRGAGRRRVRVYEEEDCYPVKHPRSNLPFGPHDI